MSFFFERRVNKPRKAKQCYWCCELCPTDEPKIVLSGVWQGDFFSDSWHLECNAARRTWQDENRDAEELPWMGEMRRGKPFPKWQVEVQA